MDFISCFLLPGTVKIGKALQDEYPLVLVAVPGLAVVPPGTLLGLHQPLSLPLPALKGVLLSPGPG